MMKQLEDAITKLKKNKSPGTDRITAKMLHDGGEQLADKIHELYNKVWREETISKEWGTANFSTNSQERRP